MIDYDAASEILSEMVQTARTFRVAGQHNKDQSLTGTKFGFLQQLRHGDARMSDLADLLFVSAPVASRAIDALAAEGLAERRTDPSDARASLISITDRGRVKLTEGESHAVHSFAAALSDWSPADAARAISMLNRLNSHLLEITQPSDPAQTAPSPQHHDD